jgi:DNA-binding NarL/FixJ family response regulator
MGDQIKVVIADNQGLFRELLHLALRPEGDIKIVGEAADARQAIDLASDLKPDVVLLDCGLSMMQDIEVLQEIREKSLNTKALILSSNKDEATIFSALKAGAKGYISKDASISNLIKAIQVVHEGELWVERKKIARFFDREAFAESREDSREGRPEKELSPREKEILCILASGCTNREIAKSLFISEKTVKSHLNSVYKKLNVTRRLQAILYAVNRGLSKAELS